MPKSSAPKQPKFSLLQIMSTLAILGVLAWAFIQFVLIEAQPKPMIVKVTLDNRCGIVESAFIAVADNGVSVPFDGGVAVLPTYSNARIAVKNSSKFSGFSYETATVPAAPNVTITAECQPAGTAEKSLKLFNEQFKTLTHVGTTLLSKGC